MIYIKDVNWEDRKQCLEAVKENAYNLAHVRHQDEEMCLIAMRKTGFALSYVREQTPEIVIAAMENDIAAITMLNNLMEEDQQVRKYIIERKLKLK